MSPRPPYECPQHDASTNAQTHASEAEAMQVYRRLSDEYFRLLLEGGALEPTPIIVETPTELYQQSIMTGLRHHKENGMTVLGPAPMLQMAADRTGAHPDSEVVLTACEDATRSALDDRDGTKRSDGRMLVTQVFFKHSDGRLMVFSTDRLDGVSTCPFEHGAGTS